MTSDAEKELNRIERELDAKESHLESLWQSKEVGSVATMGSPKTSPLMPSL